MVIFFSGRSFPVLNLVIRLRMHMSDLSPGLICTAHQPFPTDCACCVRYPDSLISLLCLPPTELMTFHLFIRNYGSAWAWRPSLTTWHYIKLRPPLFFFLPRLYRLPSPLSPSRFADQSLSQITFNGPIMNDDKAPRGPGPQNSFNHGENAQSNALKLLSCAIGSQLKLGYPPSKWQILIEQTILARSRLRVCVQDLWSSQCWS